MKIIKYHFVRDFEDEKSKNLKGLNIEDFDYQIQFLVKNFNIINYKEVREKILRKKYDPNDCWLTFDDGYFDHIICSLKSTGINSF